MTALDLREFRGKLVCQKDSFLCAAKGVSIGIEFSKRLGRGLFGGEGFIMQKLEGDGQGIHAGGNSPVQKELLPGEVLRVDTGCLVGHDRAGGLRHRVRGRHPQHALRRRGLFFATLKGPGHVWIQSLPFSRLADNIIAAAPRWAARGKEEGSILGGLGRMLDGN